MTEAPVLIVDLEGTLSLADDAPNTPVVNALIAHVYLGYEIWILSDSSEELRQQTEEWLDKFVLSQLYQDLREDVKLVMRPAGDFTPDDELKMRWLVDGTIPPRERVSAVFDDHQKVVNAWRAAGLTCFQVAPGDS